MKIKFLPQNIEVEGTPNKSLLQIATENKLEIRSICKGVPSCAECRIRITEGERNVLPPTKAELNLIGSSHFIDGRRLSCQVRCYGDVTVDLSEQVERAEHQTKKIRGFRSQKQIESQAVNDTFLLDVKEEPAPPRRDLQQPHDAQGSESEQTQEPGSTSEPGQARPQRQQQQRQGQQQQRQQGQQQNRNEGRQQSSQKSGQQQQPPKQGQQQNQGRRDNNNNNNQRRDNNQPRQQNQQAKGGGNQPRGNQQPQQPRDNQPRNNQPREAQPRKDDNETTGDNPKKEQT
jgi:ferredoxin